MALAWRLTSAVCLATLCPYCPVRRCDNRRPPRHHLRVLTTELEEAGRWPWLSVWSGRRPGWAPGTRQIGHGNGWQGSAGSCTGASPRPWRLVRRAELRESAGLAAALGTGRGAAAGLG